jgi:hypothetical protein
VTKLFPGVVASGISGHLWAPVGAYEQIASTTVGPGGVSTITFSGIPLTYTHLQLRMIGLGESDPTITVNSTSPTKGHHLVGTGTTVSSVSIYGQYLDYAYAFSTSYPSVGVLDFLDYADTNKNKTLRYLYGQDRNGTGEVLLGSKFWNSTSAISSITITATINQYSSFALYGVN